LICEDDFSSRKVEKVPNGGEDGEVVEKKRRAADQPNLTQMFLDCHIPNENINAITLLHFCSKTYLIRKGLMCRLIWRWLQ
jgi:hypothetical protein